MILEAELSRIKVLFVDDDETVRDVFRTVMAVRVGFDETVTCGSAEEALKKLECQPFDVVITDIIMEGMDGLELSEIVLDKYQTPVVLVTGYAKEDVMPLGFEGRAICCLHKPCSISDIIEKIKEALELKEELEGG